MRKRFFSLALVIALIATVPTACLSEEAALSAHVEAEIPPADWVGENGLFSEADPSPEIMPEQDAKSAAEEPLEPADGDATDDQTEAQDGETPPAGGEAQETPGEDGAETTPEESEETEPEATPVPEAKKLELSTSKMSLGVRETREGPTVKLLPEGSEGVIKWRSGNKKIVKVDAATGELTGVKAGTATVYATLANGTKKGCKITVKAAPDMVSLSPEAATLGAGQTLSLKATLPKNTASALKCSTSKKSVARVDENGVVTAVGPGTAKITVETFNGKTATCVVTVLAAPKQVKLPVKLTLAEGERKTVTATVIGKGGAEAFPEVTYSAEAGTGSIEIDARTGELVGLRKGTAKIRVVTYNGVSTHLSGRKRVETVCKVTVEEGPAEVVLAAKKVTVGLNQTFALEPIVIGSLGSELKNAAYTVRSTNAKKLGVTDEGVIKGLATGSAKVVVEAFNGVKATCTVKVVKAPDSVTLSPAKPVIGMGQTAKLTVRLTKGTMAAWAFASSDPEIVSVDGEGNITGRKPGTAVIKVKTHNGKTATANVTVTRAPDYIALNGDYVLEFDPLTSRYSVLYAKTLKKGKTFQIKYENEYLTNGDIVGYESEDEDVAVVSAKGLVTAVAPGETIIVVRSSGGAEARLRVTVPGSATGTLEFTAAAATVPEGRQIQAPGVKGSGISAEALASAKYVSSDKRVFTVTWSDSMGCWMLTGVGTGEAELIASAEKATARIPVEVTEASAPTQMAFPDEKVYMRVGDSYAPQALDEYGAVVPATLASDNPEIVRAEEDGRLTALAEGDAVITAVCGDLSCAMRVCVRGGIATVALNADFLTLAVGKRFVLQASVNGDGSSAQLSFGSSDPAVATVNADGLVVARAVGSAVITATAQGTTAQCVVNVAPAPSALSIEPASIVARLDEGGAELKWSFGAPDEVGAVAFSSNKPSVVQVDEDGRVRFNKVGTARITAVTDNGLKASVDVTVLPEQEVSDKPTYRLFAAYSYFDSEYKGYLPFPRNNARSVAGVFGTSSIAGLAYTTKVMGNPSKTQLLSGIAGFFSGTNDNDVSVVFLCSHGHMTGNYTGYRLSLPGYAESPNNPNYYLSAQEIFNCVCRIRGSVVLILDSCYSGTFLEDMAGQLSAQEGRIAVMTAASDTRATYYNVKDTNRAVDFFSFFMLQGLGYNERDGWWNGNAAGSQGAYPGYLAADIAGNGDGIVTVSELFVYVAKCIEVNIPVYMKKSWYWGDKTRVQVPRYYGGQLDDLVIYQPGK